MPTYSTGELAWLSFLTKISFVELTWHGMIQEDMKNKEFRIHPTQKPVALYKWLLKNYAKEGDIILDTHVGSGSSLIAFEDEKFDYVACELDKDYYEASLKRLMNNRQQLELF
jgi:site-specific DNA-methyltransferase (adenine-specific)